MFGLWRTHFGSDKTQSSEGRGRAHFKVVFCRGGGCLRLILDGSGRRETGERSLHENGLGSVSVKTSIESGL